MRQTNDWRKYNKIKTHTFNNAKFIVTIFSRTVGKGLT